MKRYAGFRLRHKMLLGNVGAVVAALVPTFLVVNYWLSASVNRTIGEDFLRAERTFSQLRDMRDSLLIWEGLAFTNSPKLFAAVETGDPATVQDVLFSELPDLARRDLFAVYATDGRLLAAGGARAAPPAGGGASVEDDAAGVAGRFSGPVERALGGRVAIGSAAISDRLFEAAAAPLLVGDRIVGALLVGNLAGRALVENLRQMTGSDVALRVGDRITLSTLPAEKQASLGQALREGPLAASGADPPASPGPPAAREDPEGLAAAAGQRITLQGERYLCSRIPYRDAAGATIGEFLLLQSMDRAIGFFDDLRKSLVAIAVLAAGLALVLAAVIARGVARHIGNLLEGVREVERGRYDRPIRSRATDEIGYLAGVFEEMRVSLQAKMEEASRLTEDLRAKNVALEETLTKLRSTQEELIQSEKLALTSRLTTQLSHELNNPIYNIQTCIEVLQKRVGAADESREFIDMAYAEVQRMTKLTKQMLSFGKPARDELVATDLNKVLGDLLHVSTRWLEGRGIRVEARLAPALPRIHASADQLRQVFLNLIVNASDAMPQGGQLVVETGARGGQVFARVADTGCGIAPENLDKIFDAFFTTKSAMSGVGLGLSISYGIVERHRGRIEVESEPGKGARFTTSFPASAA